MKKVLLVGNYSCVNRGDAAILRGLLHFLEKNFSAISCTVMSQFPRSASIILDREVIADPLFEGRLKSQKSQWHRLKNRLSLFMVWLKTKIPFFYFPFPKHFRNFQTIVEEHDLIIYVGGSNFVDLYGIIKYEHPLICLLAKKPIFFLGHSIGPYNNRCFKWLSGQVLPQINSLVFREELSLKLYQESFGKTSNVEKGGDTAWLVDNFTQEKKKKFNFEGNKWIAFTSRNLAPFDKRLGITQDQYEILMAHFLDRCASKGYRILGLATCTSLDNYHEDDRITAYQIKKRMKQSDACEIIWDELTDIEFGQIASQCEYLLGTRLHSCIIAMNFGTPCLAIYYEHKTEGILRQLGMEEDCIKIEELDLETTWERFYNKLNQPSWREKVKTLVIAEKRRTEEVLKRVLKKSFEQQELLEKNNAQSLETISPYIVKL